MPFAFVSLLAASQTIVTVTPSEYLAKFPNGDAAEGAFYYFVHSYYPDPARPEDVALLDWMSPVMNAPAPTAASRRGARSRDETCWS